jgi:uncharacterized membrane protein YgdD (TMEM256/DUF423 family)
VIRVAAILGFTGVLLGAFGAHGLRQWVDDPHRLEVWDMAARYHLLHAVALLAAAPIGNRAVGWAFSVGVLIFSGSLYALALTGFGPLGAVTPIGGATLLVGWALLLVRR